MRLLGRSAAVAIVASLAAAGVRADDPAQAPWEDETEISLGALLDDNAFLGRRGQIIAGPELDVVNLVGLRHESGYRVDRGLRVVGVGSANFAVVRLQEPLRGADFLLRLSVERALGNTARVVPEVAVASHLDATVPFSFFAVRPALRAELPPLGGLLTDLRYELSSQDFTGDAPRLTFANLDNTSHRGEARLRHWLGDAFRLALTYRVDVFSFSSNLSPDPRLAAFVGLPPDIGRVDLVNVLQPELTVLFDTFIVTLGYRLEDNRSNSDAFTFVGHRGIASAYWEPSDSHILFGELRVGRADFYRFRFDSRYRDTRADLRLDAAASYRFVIDDHLYLQGRYSFLSNDSNDALDFNPATSLSFSTFRQNRIEVLGVATFK